MEGQGHKGTNMDHSRGNPLALGRLGGLGRALGQSRRPHSGEWQQACNLKSWMAPSTTYPNLNECYVRGKLGARPRRAYVLILLIITPHP